MHLTCIMALMYILFYPDVLVFGSPTSGALPKHQCRAAPDLPSYSVSYCCVPFEGSFAKLLRKGTFFCSRGLNANMNKCESHQKAPEQPSGPSSSQPALVPPAKEVSGTSRSSSISGFRVV